MMPELPEVETIKLGLQRLLLTKEIKSVSFDWNKSFPNASADVNNFLINSHIISVRRRAKVLIIDLSSEYSLVIHLKMTGQLVYISEKNKFGAGHPNSSLIGKLPDKSTRVTFAFKDGSRLYFNDQRKFGWVRLMPTNQIQFLDFFKKVGPEPLDNNFNAEILRERLLRRKKTSIKPALLDQTVIAGVGNIYADESLWGAKIHPSTLVGALTKKQIENLYQELIFVLKLSIEKGGSTDKNYINAEGKKGSYLQFARVFRREGLACPRDNEIIQKIRVAGRGTHYCPECQIFKS